MFYILDWSEHIQVQKFTMSSYKFENSGRDYFTNIRALQGSSCEVSRQKRIHKLFLDTKNYLNLSERHLRCAWGKFWKVEKIDFSIRFWPNLTANTNCNLLYFSKFQRSSYEISMTKTNQKMVLRRSKCPKPISETSCMLLGQILKKSKKSIFRLKFYSFFAYFRNSQN